MCDLPKTGNRKPAKMGNRTTLKFVKLVQTLLEDPTKREWFFKVR